MIETNPYRLEEAEWTPGNVYDIIPPGDLSHTGFEYSEGSDNIDEEEVRNSLVSGVADFFGKLLGGVGKILGGAIEAGAGILCGIVQGVTGLIGGIASAIGSIFGGGNNTEIEPPEPVFNPIKTNLEGAIQPHLDDIEEAKGKIEAAQQEQESIKADIVAQGKNLSTALSKADKGIADAKAAQNSANQAISDVETKSGELSAEIEAQRKASLAREEALKKEINPKIEAAQSKGDNAMTEAQKAIENAEFVAGFADDLIPKDAEGKSTWGSNLEPGDVSPPESAFGSERTYIMSSTTRAPEPFIPVKGQEVYRVTVWVKQHPDSTNSGFSFHLKSATGYAGWTHVRKDFGEWNTKEEMSNPYVLVPSEGWGKYTIDFRWPESAGPAYLQLQQNSGGKFYVHDAQVRVIAPVDNSVDLAQNDAIRANQEILRQQQEINALNTAFQEEQKVINATKNELDTLQNEAIKANSKVGETNTTAVEALKAAVDSIEQIVGLDNAYKAQQDQINDQLTERQDILEEIQGLQNQMIARTIVYQDKTTVYDDYVTVTGSSVTAKGNWVGNLVITCVSRTTSSEDGWSTSIEQHSVPELNKRVFSYYSGLSSNLRATRVDYWVYPGKSIKSAIEGAANYISGSSFTAGTWGLIESFTMPENTGSSILNWESKLLNADRDVTYQVRLLVDGVQKKSYKASGKGPMFPWEDGTSYIRFIWDIDIPTGATVRIEGAASGSKANSTRAKTSYNRGTLTYTQIPEGS